MHTAAKNLEIVSFTHDKRDGQFAIVAHIHGVEVWGRGASMDECLADCTQCMRHVFDNVTSQVVADGEVLKWDFPAVKPDWMR